MKRRSWLETLRGLPPPQRFGWIAVALFLGALVIAREARSPDGHDFQAFHNAGQRLLSFVSPYRADDAYPFKYAPVVGLAFVPIGWLSIKAALWVFIGLSWIAVLSIPWFVQSILVRDPQAHHAAARPRLVLKSFLIGLVASLRFIDNEYHSIQINLVVTALLLSAVYLWTDRRRKRDTRAAALYIFGAFFKFHPLLGLGVFLKSGRAVLKISAVALGLALVPWPPLWAELVKLLEVTTPLFEISKASIFMQGFYPFASQVLGLEARSITPFLVFVPVAALAVLLVPKFGFRDEEGPTPAQQPAAFLASVLALLLLAVTSSPLPWQHTYSILWAALPTAYLLATFSERRFLLALALFLGLTPRAIIGPEASRALEEMHVIFYAALLVSVTLLAQARRLRRNAKADSTLVAP